MAHWDAHGSGLLHIFNAHLAMDGNTNDVMTREDVLLDAYILSTVIQQPGYQNRCISHCGDCVEEEGLPCIHCCVGYVCYSHTYECNTFLDVAYCMLVICWFYLRYLQKKCLDVLVYVVAEG